MDAFLEIILTIILNETAEAVFEKGAFGKMN